MQKSPIPAWDDLRIFLAVMRGGSASAAARQLGLDHTTVARRVRALEEALGTLLFERSRRSGFLATTEGQRLLTHAETMESALQAACESVSGSGGALSGQVRIGCTEAFGSHFIIPALASFQDTHPDITLDVLPVPHFVSLSRREADIAITLERPARGPYVTTRLCNYALGLYATPDYLARHADIHSCEDLRAHRFVSYIEDLAFSRELLYLDEVMPHAQRPLRSTSALAQHQAVRGGQALGILPCFLADADAQLVRVLPETVHVVRQFWMSYSEDLRRLRRVTTVAAHLATQARLAEGLLLGRACVSDGSERA